VTDEIKRPGRPMRWADGGDLRESDLFADMTKEEFMLFDEFAVIRGFGSIEHLFYCLLKDEAHKHPDLWEKYHDFFDRQDAVLKEDGEKVEL
jgi:hypothetical protein